VTSADPTGPTAAQATLVLYDAPGSPCARRVRITLLEKGLSWETRLVDLSRLEQKKPEYLALNPNGVVPTLVHGDRVVYESNVITEYLDDVFPDVRLYPEDPHERAQLKLWQAFELSFAKDFRPLMYQRLLGPVVRLTRTLDEALEVARRSTANAFDLEWERKVWSLAVLAPDEERAAGERLLRRLDPIEAALRESDFLVGGRFTQAEVSLFPRLRMYAFVQLRIAPDRFPRTAAWMARLERRPSFAASLHASDLGLQRLGDSPLLPWIAARLKRPPASLALHERAGLGLARAALKRAMRGRSPRATPERARALPVRAEATRPTMSAGRPEQRPAGTEHLAAPLAASRAAAAEAPLTLWEAPLSPSCRRVRILLRHLGVAAESVPVDLGRMEQKSVAFLARNPNGEVPVLRHGDRVLSDSALISEYLDASFADAAHPSVFPAEPHARARVRMWIASDQATHKEWRPLYFQSVVGPSLRESALAEADLLEGQADFVRRAARGTLLTEEDTALVGGELLRMLDRVESALSASPCLVGETPTAADIAWFSRVELFPRLGLALAADRFANVLAWSARLRELPAFAADREDRRRDGGELRASGTAES
jgi:glutathione S-transferase